MPAPVTDTPPTTTWWDTQAPATTEKPDQFGKDTFLKLLVAQLKYQNPMSPADSSEFLAQTAQFSMVEKLDQMNTQTAAIATSQRLMEASNMVGKTVTFYDSDGAPQNGTVIAALLDPSGPVLRVGAYYVPLSLIEGVVATPATPLPPATTTTESVPTADQSSTTEPTGKPGDASTTSTS